MTPRRLLTILALSALAGGLSACGQESSITKGETEGVYVDVGPMKYQVQVSRELNPAIPEDRTFLTGLSRQDAAIRADEAWFAIFVRIENETTRPQPAAMSYVIEDTEGNEYRPVPLGRDNPFAYAAHDIPAESASPDPNSVAAQTSINGLELLFKIKRTSFDDRPLILTIHSPANFSEVSEVDLDV